MKVAVGISVGVGLGSGVSVGAELAMKPLMRGSAIMLLIPRQYRDETPRNTTMSTTCSVLDCPE